MKRTKNPRRPIIAWLDTGKQWIALLDCGHGRGADRKSRATVLCNQCRMEGRKRVVTSLFAKRLKAMKSPPVFVRKRVA